MDTYDNDSVGKESKCEKDGFMVENRKSNIEENLGDFRKSSVGKEVVDEKKQSVGLAKCDSSWRDTKHDRQPVHEVFIFFLPIPETFIYSSRVHKLSH